MDFLPPAEPDQIQPPMISGGDHNFARVKGGGFGKTGKCKRVIFDNIKNRSLQEQEHVAKNFFIFQGIATSAANVK
jgi:hypothetical protein